MRGRTIALVMTGFLVGVAGASEGTLSVGIVLFCSLLAAALLGVGFLRFIFSRKMPLILMYLISLIIGFAWGAWHFEERQEAFAHAAINTYAGQKVILSGFVVSESEITSGQERVLLDVDKIIKDANTEMLNASTIVSITLQSGTNFEYGESLQLEGKLAPIKNNDDSFDYASYEKTKGILYEMYFPHVVSDDGFEGNKFIQFLYKAKDYFESNIDSFFREPYASLASGMAIAGKGSLSTDMQTIFLRAGIIHIVVLSGYNISLVVSFASLFLRRFHLRWRVLLTALFVVLFVLMVGTSASVLRAGLMSFAVLGSNLFHRPLRQNRVLLLVSFLMIYWNPYSLVFDPSFALTFLATFAMINVAPIIEERCTKITERFSLREIVSQTIAAELMVTPYLIYQMGTFSVIAPLTNLLVLPVVPLVTILSVIVGVLGFLRVVLYPAVVVLQFGLAWIVFIAKSLGGLWFAFVQIDSFSLAGCVAIYIIVALLLFLFKIKKGLVLKSQLGEEPGL